MRDRPDGPATLSCPTPYNGLLLEGLIPGENEKPGLTEVKHTLTPRHSYSIHGIHSAEVKKSMSTNTLHKHSPGGFFENAQNWKQYSTGVPGQVNG